MKENLSVFSQFKDMFSHFKTTKKKLFIFLGIVTALILGVGIYFVLVPFNIVNGGFRTFIAILLTVWCIPLALLPQVFGKGKKRRKADSTSSFI